MKVKKEEDEDLAHKLESEILRSEKKYKKYWIAFCIAIAAFFIALILSILKMRVGK